MRQRILVIDADVAFLSMLQMRLKSIGHIVNTAETGWDGLTKLEHANYDVILLDFTMPRLTGLTVLQHLQERQPSVPVVIMTWHSGRQVAAQALTAGARACLIKPVDPVALDRALQGCAGTAASERSYQGFPMTPRVMRPSRNM